MRLVSPEQTPEEIQGLPRVVDAEVKLVIGADGVERLAQEKVHVQVVGDQDVGTLETPGEAVRQAKEAGPVVKRERVGRIIIHEAHVAKLIRNTKRLQAILDEPETAALVQKKGL